MSVTDNGSKILVVDDNPANIDILLELLQAYDVRAALDGESALKTVLEDLPDLILLDVSMPGMNGFEVCKRLKASGRTKDIPVVFLTADHEDASVLKGFEVGGVDYITKPYLAREVLARVKTHLQLFHALRQLSELAMTDPMTGISNRRKFFLRAHRLIEQAKQKNVPLFLALIDLDGFKAMNDTYGHDAGDLIIKRFANTTAELLPEGSCFARLGGDEFILMLSGSKDRIAKQLEMVRVMASRIKPIAGQDLKISTSIGLSVLRDKNDSVDTILKRADRAVYKAKEAGGNKIVANL